jgi:hypothetical protein
MVVPTSWTARCGTTKTHVLGELGRLTSPLHRGCAELPLSSTGRRRSSASGTAGPWLDIGFDYGRAHATDALKKCASLIGVGLYLSRKGRADLSKGTRGAWSSRATALVHPHPSQWDTDGNVVGGTPTCEVCGEEITDRKRRDGSIWFAAEVAEYSRKTCQGRVLCYEHSRNAG